LYCFYKKFPFNRAHNVIHNYYEQSMTLLIGTILRDLL